MQEMPTSVLDYEKLGIIAYLTVSIWLFLKGTVMTAAAHEKQMAQLRSDYEARLNVEKERTQEWKEMAKAAGQTAKQTATAAREIVDVVKTAGTQ